MFIGVYVGRAFYFVNDLLEFDRVSIGVADLSWICERYVFETVDFTETPEHGVSILATSLYLE